jgi:hypothetical protein
MSKKKIKVGDVLYTRHTEFKVKVVMVHTGDFRFGVTEMYDCVFVGTNEPVKGQIEPCDLMWSDSPFAKACG